MKFTEEKLEQAVIGLFEAEDYEHLTGEHIHKEIFDVLLRDDLKQYLLNRYSDEDITLNEIETIIRKLEAYPSSALYESNKAIMKLVADGFLLKREDRLEKKYESHDKEIKFVFEVIKRLLEPPLLKTKKIKKIGFKK